MPLTMQPGGSYRVDMKKLDKEPGNPDLTFPTVDVKPHVAARCRYLGRMRLIKGRVCAFFVDVETETVYAQPAPKEG